MKTQASDAEVKQSAGAQYIAQRRPEPFNESFAVYDASYNPPLLVKYMGDDEELAAKQAARWNAGKFKESDSEKVKAIRLLRAMLEPGDTISTILRHCSRSGMNRRISLVIAREGEVHDITWDAAHAMGDPIRNRAGYVQDVGIEVGGCGMDMGFHLVYNLSRTLFPEGFQCSGEHCGSNDHNNRVQPPPGTCTEHAKRQPQGTCKDLNCKPWFHSGDGGYALRQRWL